MSNEMNSKATTTAIDLQRIHEHVVRQHVQLLLRVAGGVLRARHSVWRAYREGDGG